MVVHLEGTDATREVSVDEIDQWFDLPQANYAIRSRAGQSDPASESVGNALSIRELVARLAAEPGTAFSGIAAESVQLVSVPDDRNGYVATLAPPNLGPAGSNGFTDAKLPAIFAAANDSVGYVRPLTSDVNDVNNRDYIQANTQAPLDLTLSLTGSVLTPTITATPDNPSAGDPVSFAVSVRDAPPGQLTYAWSFDGGGRSSEAKPSYTWNTNGTYTANVVVQAVDGSVGQASVTVSVGSRPSASPSAGSSSGPGGGTDPDPDAPSQGPDQGSSGSKVGGKVTPQASPTAVSTSGPSGTNGDDGPSPTDGATGSGSVPAPALPPTASPGPASSVDAGSVTGLLLSSAALPPQAGTTDESELTAPTARAQPAAASGPVDPLVWTSALVPFLVLAGAAGELRPGRLRSRRFRRVAA